MRGLFVVAHRMALTALVLSLGLAVGGCSSPRSAQQSQAHTAQTPAAMKTVRIPVEGMSCSACVASIKTALSELDGVFRVDVDLGQRVARVQFSPAKVSSAAIVAKINDLGYRAGPATEVN